MAIALQHTFLLTWPRSVDTIIIIEPEDRNHSQQGTCPSPCLSQLDGPGHSGAEASVECVGEGEDTHQMLLARQQQMSEAGNERRFSPSQEMSESFATKGSRRARA